MTGPVIAITALAFRAQPQMPFSIPQPHPANPAVGTPLMIVENQVRIRWRKLDMGDPSLGHPLAKQLLSRRRVIDAEVGRQPFGYDPLVNIVIGFAREFLVAIQRSCVGRGHAQSLAIG